jgi:hypothetical protein
MKKDYFQLIKEHSIATRQIPKKIVRHWTINKNETIRDSDTIVESLCKHTPLKHQQQDPMFIFKNGQWYRRLKEEVKTPKDAGKWMCQISPNDTSCELRWDKKRDNLADTLEGSIDKLLKKI